jgi:hypothetical protein
MSRWTALGDHEYAGHNEYLRFILPVFETAASNTNLTTAALEAHDEKLLDGTRPKDSKIVTGTAPDAAFSSISGPPEICAPSFWLAYRRDLSGSWYIFWLRC